MAAGIAGACLAALIFSIFKEGAHRREAIQALVELDRLIRNADSAPALAKVILPPSQANAQQDAQAAWLRSTLQDEISDTGIHEMQRHADFGALKELFPVEGLRWAASAQVQPDDCVAFRMERNGITAEVVLHRSASGMRILRCNNIKQMAPDPTL